MADAKDRQRLASSGFVTYSLNSVRPFLIIPFLQADKGKPVVRPGRKAMDPPPGRTARLPKLRPRGCNVDSFEAVGA